MTTWHAYTCEKGCGHTTTIDKFYKSKRVFCGVCGTKSTMVYQGERLVTEAPKTTPFSFKDARGNTRPVKMTQYNPFKN